MTEAFFSKTSLRQAFRTNLSRGDTDEAVVRANTETLNFNLTRFLKTRSGKWAAFEPIGFEPDIRSVIEAADHISWVYPRVEGETLKFYAVKSRADLVENKWKILEPNPAQSQLVDVSELTGLLVPGLAFDAKCNRLGRGKGYYDRALQGVSQGVSKTDQSSKTSSPLKIGIALERQVSSMSLPSDPHDVVMDKVITESRIIERTHP